MCDGKIDNGIAVMGFTMASIKLRPIAATLAIGSPMNNRFEYEPASEIVKLLQITDPHLFKDTSKDLLGINTHEVFSGVKEIQLEPFGTMSMLATGDLVQDQ